MKGNHLAIRLTITLFYFVLSGCVTQQEKRMEPPTPNNPYLNFVIPWIEGKDLTISDIDNYYQKQDKIFKSKSYENRWLPLRKKIMKGDRVVFFTTPCELWKDLRGMAGFAVLRNDFIVGYIGIMFS